MFRILYSVELAMNLLYLSLLPICVWVVSDWKLSPIDQGWLPMWLETFGFYLFELAYWRIRSVSKFALRTNMLFCEKLNNGFLRSHANMRLTPSAAKTISSVFHLHDTSRLVTKRKCLSWHSKWHLKSDNSATDC